MRFAFLLALAVVAPAAHAQTCHRSDAATVIQGIGASLQLSATSSQLSTAIHQLTRNECRQDTDCGGRYRCAAQQCVARDDGRTQQEQQVELFLRARSVELREELVLGRGPVIDGLAAARGTPPAQLGRAIRAHRAALRAEIGDGSDPGWSSRFLQRLDTLG